MKTTTCTIALLLLIQLSFTQVDQSHLGAGTDSYPVEESSPVAQSFTAGVSGELTEVQICISAQMCPYIRILFIQFVSIIVDIVDDITIYHSFSN